MNPKLDELGYNKLSLIFGFNGEIGSNIGIWIWGVDDDSSLRLLNYVYFNRHCLASKNAMLL